MKKNPGISCDSDEYKQASIFIYILFAVVVVLGPLLITIFLFVNRNRHQKSIQASANLSNPTDDDPFRVRYGLLFELYKKETFWYSIFNLVRRLVLVAIVTQMQGTEMFMALSLTNLLIAIVAVRSNPYTQEDDAANTMEVRAPSLLLLVFCFLMVLVLTVSVFLSSLLSCPVDDNYCNDPHHDYPHYRLDSHRYTSRCSCSHHPDRHRHLCWLVHQFALC
jgi:hypothetical protein